MVLMSNAWQCWQTCEGEMMCCSVLVGGAVIMEERDVVVKKEKGYSSG